MAEKPNDIEAIYNAALKKRSEAERSAYLDAVCGDDPVLRARVEALLKAHEEAGDFLEVPAIELNATLDKPPMIEGPGTRIGRYKLLQLIGEGGFGAVYMTEQEKPIRRRVALKIIKLGMDTKQVIARFEAERQALALMDHPNIARVFDAGATDTGRPYFVMELVKGIPITEYCDKNNLDTRQRLDLFIDVCKAVQHAHQKGIIHRDIKPSNVMITLHDGKPVPKIIDFGIAKATQHRLTEKTYFTEYRQFIGTPEYMSPEQAEMTGLDVDTRSDIYSLGVLLYELLTGTTPFEAEKLRSAAYDEIRRIIREEEPPRPSTRLSSLGEELSDVAKHRHVQPAQLCKIVRGDLDWVVMKALEKDRTRRYETANEFAADIGRHLGDEPVSAGPPSVMYQLRKFVRRNRASVTAIAAVLVVLVAGIVVSTLFAIGQARARRVALGMVQYFNKEFLGSIDPDKAKGREVTVREVLDAASDNIMGKFKSEPRVEEAIRKSLGVTYLKLGKYTAAEPHLKRSLEICREQLGEEDPVTLEAMNTLGALYLEQGRYDEAAVLFAKVLEVRRRVLGEEHVGTLFSKNYIAALYCYQGRYEEAEPIFVEVLAFRRRVLGEEHPDTLESISNLGAVYLYQGRYGEADLLFAEALDDQHRVLGEEHPDTVNFMYNLAALYLLEGRYDKAETLFVKVLGISRRVLGEEHPSTLNSMAGMASLYREQELYDKSEALLIKVLKGRRRVLGEEHPHTLRSMNNLIKLYEAWGKPEKAEEWRAKLPDKDRSQEQ